MDKKIFLHSIDDQFREIYKMVFEFTIKNNKKANKKMDEYIAFLNKCIKPYGGKIEKIQEEYYVSFPEPFKLAGGVYTTAFVLLKSNKVIHLAIDNVKIGWQLYNKYIKVYELKSFNINEFRYTYFLVTERYTTFSEFDKTLLKTFDKSDMPKIIKQIYDIVDQYNTVNLNIAQVFDAFKNTVLNYKYKNKEIKEQFEMFVDYVNLVSKEFECDLDFHNGNFVYDSKNKVWIITDPIYSGMLNGYKTPNHISRIILEGFYKGTN